MGSTWLIVRETPAHRFSAIRREHIPAIWEPHGSGVVARLIDWWHTWRQR